MLELDVYGMKVSLGIKDYKVSNRETWDSDWCRCDFVFKFGDIIDYQRFDNEVLLSDEVVDLEEKLSLLLEDKIDEVTEVKFIEPDFIFMLHPKRDLREDPKYTYIREGYEIEDILVEWKIYFWNGGLTDNHLTVTLSRKHIVELRDYLKSVIQ